MKEIWRDVKDYEGKYEVSNLGRVRSLNYLHTGKERLLKKQLYKNGYEYVCLYKNGEEKKCKIHRLVAMAFIPNPDGLPCVNHKDENPSNNVTSNLEWCTAAYNNAYGTRTERTFKRVYQYMKDGSFVRSYCSTQEASRVTGVKQSNISACCLNRPHFKTAGGYIWSFEPPTPTTDRTLF